MAKAALAGDSNDEEHDALLALVEVLDECELLAYRDYSSDWLIEDFIGWAGIHHATAPDGGDIRDYVREARPADSSRNKVKSVLLRWAKEFDQESADPYGCMSARGTESNQLNELRCQD